MEPCLQWQLRVLYWGPEGASYSCLLHPSVHADLGPCQRPWHCPSARDQSAHTTRTDGSAWLGEKPSTELREDVPLLPRPGPLVGSVWLCKGRSTSRALGHQTGKLAGTDCPES